MTSPLTRPAHVRDLLRALADEGDHEEDLRVVRRDAVGDVLEEHRLAGLRRADDQRALALPDRVDEVDQALAQVLRVRLEVDAARSGGSASGRRSAGRRRAVSGSTPLTESTRSMPQYFSPSRGARDGAADAVADPEPEPAHLAGADVDVVRARHEAVPAHEPVALVDDVEDPGRRTTGRARSDWRWRMRVDEVVAPLDVARLDLELLVAVARSSAALIPRSSAAPISGPSSPLPFSSSTSGKPAARCPWRRRRGRRLRVRCGSGPFGMGMRSPAGAGRPSTAEGMGAQARNRIRGGGACGVTGAYAAGPRSSSTACARFAVCQPITLPSVPRGRPATSRPTRRAGTGRADLATGYPLAAGFLVAFAQSALKSSMPRSVSG